MATTAAATVGVGQSLLSGGGSSGCPCIDVSSVLKTFQDCKTLSGFPGVRPRNNKNVCYPLNYGSNKCKPHDNHYDPNCAASSDGKPIPGYCSERWCFVDYDKCKVSNEVFFQSTEFDVLDNSSSAMNSSTIDLYYSYSTCNSSDVAWNEFVTTKALAKHSNLKVTIPQNMVPHHFKPGDASRDGVDSGLYYNNSIPFEGALIDFFGKVVDFSSDIHSVEYQFRSRGSDTLSPLSAFTASVFDVRNGLADIAVGPFWITSTRLQMVAFTTTITMDKTFLVVKRPQINESFKFQIEKLIKPFDKELWIMLIVAILAVGILSMWFASPSAKDQGTWIAFRNDRWRHASCGLRFFICYRQILESSLQKGVSFFGGAVDFEYESAFSYKILMFGFSFLILISISSYVANLAAFLTLTGVTPYIETMDQAIANNIKICAHPVVREHLEGQWPDAKFVFSKSRDGYTGIIDGFESGKCEAMAISWVDTRYDKGLMDQFCELDVVFTKGMVMEIPMAFPVRTELSAGISHWLVEAQEDLNFSFDDMYEKYKPNLECSVEIATDDVSENQDEFPSLTVRNMSFPFLILIACAVLAVINKLCNRRKLGKYARKFAKTAGLNRKDSKHLIESAKIMGSDLKDLETYDPDNLDDEDSFANEDDDSSNNHFISSYIQKLEQRKIDKCSGLSHRAPVTLAETESSHTVDQYCGNYDSQRSLLDPNLSHGQLKNFIESAVEASVSKAIEKMNANQYHHQHQDRHGDMIPV